MKRICFLTDSIFSFGGYDVTIVTKDKPEQKDTTFYGLDKTNIHYRFFSFPEVSRWKYYFCKAYSYLYRRHLPQTRLTSDLYAYSSFPHEQRKALYKELREGHYDVIIGVHAPLAVRLATCRHHLQGTRLIGWIHNSYQALFGEGSLYIGPELCKHYELQLAKLDKTVVLCHDDAQKYHIPTEVIYNPLTLVPGAPSEGTSKKFLAVGRFSHLHKGFDLLIEAFRIFAQDNQEWTLDIVGEGVEEPLYQQLIEKYHLQERITIHPFTNNIQQYYHEAQVYVLSSRWEGMPLVLMEAMSHGLPIISSNLPICKEIMGDFGLYFSNGDANGLAHQMQAATQLDWPSTSQKAIAIAQQYNIETISRQWHQIIEA